MLQTLPPSQWHWIAHRLLNWAKNNIASCQEEWKFHSQIEHYNLMVSFLKKEFSNFPFDDFGFQEVSSDCRTTVVIPVYNEESSVEDVVERVAKVPTVAQIVLVNDGSQDGTESVCRKLLEEFQVREQWNQKPAGVLNSYYLPEGIKFCHLDANRGKGFAIRTGFQEAVCKWTAIQDADFEYDPFDLQRLQVVAQKNNTPIVYGNRFHETVSIEKSNGGMELLREFKEKTGKVFPSDLMAAGKRVSPLWHQLANSLLSKIASLRCKIKIDDIETCQKLFDTKLIQKIVPKLTEDRFGIEIEMTIKLAREAEASFQQAPISYSRRGYEEGKKIGWKDGVRAIYCLFAY